MSLPRTLSYFGPEKYLAFERGTDARHEYLDGHVYAMAGESIEYSRICVNVAGELRARLKGHACEVLSPSTEAYDRGERFLRYRTQIEALREYVLVSQHRPLVEHYVRRPDGSWSYTAAGDLSEAVDLPSIGCGLPLSEIYDRIIFPAGALDVEGGQWSH